MCLSFRLKNRGANDKETANDQCGFSSVSQSLLIIYVAFVTRMSMTLEVRAGCEAEAVV